jgi:hypothetical protein
MATPSPFFQCPSLHHYKLQCLVIQSNIYVVLLIKLYNITWFSMLLYWNLYWSNVHIKLINNHLPSCLTQMTSQSSYPETTVSVMMFSFPNCIHERFSIIRTPLGIAATFMYSIKIEP